MKSLKRTLCLVLALVMVLGLFGIASATSFTDDSTIQYKEAVDVMTGIGAINGMGDGTFNPKGTITRAQAAKLVTYAVLGQATAERLTGVTSSFTDVTVEGGFAWAIPSIEYLVQQGVINGMGDGTFNPNGEISGYATLKLLLCALGYGARNEYVGNQWDLNVAIDAGKAKLTAGRVGTGALSAPATREEVALYCFNTIQKDQVKYIATLDIYTDGDGSIAQNVYGFGTDLTVNGGEDADKSGADAYGRPANKWEYKGEVISTAAATPVLTYNTAMTAPELKLAIENAGYKVPAEGVVTATNGKDAAKAELGAAGGVGITTEIYANDAKTVTKVVIISTALTKASAYEEDKATTAAVDERTITIATAKGTAKVAAADKVEGFDAVYSVVKALLDSGKTEVPVLIVANADGKVVSLGVPQTADVKVTSTKTSDGNLVSFVADSKTYTVSGAADAANLDKIAAGNTITVIMDKGGFVLGATLVEANLNVGVVIDHGTIDSGFESGKGYQIKLVGLDGKEVILPVSQLAIEAGDPAEIKDTVVDDFNKLDNAIVTYTPDIENEGKFVVTRVNDDVTTADIKIVTGNVNVDTGVSANDNTVFIVQTIDATSKKASYNVYTGVKNVPSLTAAKYDAYDKADDGFADVVYVLDAQLTGAGTNQISFLAFDSTKEIKLAGKGDAVFYETAIISGGAYTDIQSAYLPQTVAATLLKDKVPMPIVSSYVLKDGVITSATVFAGSEETSKPGVSATGIGRAANGVITIGDTKHTYESNCIVWEIDSSKTEVTDKFVPKTVAQIAADEEATVYFVENSKTGAVSAIYIIKATEEGGGSEDTPSNVAKLTSANVTVNGSGTNAVTLDEKTHTGTVTITSASTTDKLGATGVASDKGTVTPVTDQAIVGSAGTNVEETITLTVTAEDGKTTQNYTITVTISTLS